MIGFDFPLRLCIIKRLNPNMQNLFSNPRRRCFVRLILIAALACPAAVQAFTGLSAVSKETQRRMALETQLTIEFLEKQHYKRMPFEAIEAQTLLINFMKELDYTRMFFSLADQEEVLLRFQDALKPVYLRRGDLYPAFEVYDLYRRRTETRLEWVFARLKQPLSFEAEETFAPDRSEAGFAADATALDALWDKRLRFELLSEMLGGDTEAEAVRKIERRYLRTQRYLQEIEAGNIQESFLTTLAELYDPHSNFFSVDSADEFNIAISNSLVGIGAVLRDEDGYCTIQELIPGGPAELSGQLYPGDKIVAVAQEGAEPVEVVDTKLRKVVKMIRGEKGTRVHLTVIPAGADTSERKPIALVRDEIQLTENLASARLFDYPIDDQRTIPIGVIELPSFYGGSYGNSGAETSTSQDVEELLGTLRDLHVQGIVLDLRRNGGGLLNEAVKLAGLFIPKGPIVMVRDYEGQVRTDWDSDSKLVYDGPLVVLVSRNSASASEIVAGALQVLGRAIVVGDQQTHGKGTVQAPWDLSRSVRRFYNREERLGTVKVTIQKFYLPNGSSTQKEGVSSDIVIPSINQFLKIGESDLPNCLAWDTTEQVSWNPNLARLPNGPAFDAALLDKLRELSANRQETLDEFRYLRRNIDWFKTRQDRKEISLNLNLRRQQKEEDSQLKDELEAERERLNRHPFPNREILLAVAAEKDRQHQEKLAQALLPDGSKKSNRYYQKVFYYQPDPAEKIREVYIETLDYEKAEKNIEPIAAAMSAAAGQPVPRDGLLKTIRTLKTADLGTELVVEKIAAEAFGKGWDEARVAPLLPVFFTTIIESDPSIAKEKTPLDIGLREAIRVVADWLQLENSPFHQRLLSAWQKKHPAAAPGLAPQPPTPPLAD